jgi:hypothetical protein
MNRWIEIRSYNLKPGTRDEFHRLVVELQAMVRRWATDVVNFGPSPHDETSYFLIRAYASLEDREAEQSAFYGSAEWLEGPRESIVSKIESMTSIVLELGPDTIDALRRQ